MAQHIFGYSKSARARCHGPPPCNGSSMTVGTLRYGRLISSDVGNTVEWCHWGCVSPNYLRELAVADLDQIQGFQDLRNSDQNKIRNAIGRRHVDPADIPDTAKMKPTQLLRDSKASHSLKRKAQEDAAPSIHSQVRGSYSGVPQPGPSQLRESEQEEADKSHLAEELKDELYCIMQAKVVGMQYYTGLVGPGEEVLLEREPQNPYDRNAIQVKNISQIQVGHIPRQIAAKLAPLLDRRAITVEGVINDGNLRGKSYAMSITLKFYGPTDQKTQLERELLWATPRQRGFPKHPTPALAHHQPGISPTDSYADPSSSQRKRVTRDASEDLRKAAELRQILNNLEKVDDERRRGSLLDSLCCNEDVFNLPLHPNPPSIQGGELLTDLLKHQVQALQWCIEREYPTLPKKESEKPVQFWQMRKLGSKAYYFNLATKTPQESLPLLGRGAICGDAMGLGKTLTMLALIVVTKPEIPPDYSKTTLIISPLSVLSNWEQQINDHCVPGSLSYITYYGTNRLLSPQELTKYDIVITTYQVVSGEYSEPTSGSLGFSNKRKKSDKTLFDVQWKRIILDEGHTIRNPKTKTAKAVYALNGQRRWVLSGTPIVNSPNDLGSMLTFLQICRPLDNADFFKRLLLRPLKQGQSDGVELLRALMSQICIRRTKEMQDSQGNTLIKLPPVDMVRIPVKLNEEARRLYDEVEALAQQKLRNMLRQSANANLNPVQSNALAMLTRLRQLALHPGLIPENYIEELKCTDGQVSHVSATVTPEEKLCLQGMLLKAIEDCEECPICIGLPNEPRITICGHVFCLSCITEVLSRDPKCPMDRRPISRDDLHEPLPPMECTQPFATLNSFHGPSKQSAKIEQLVYLLKSLPSSDKSLVFSQFTSFMDKIAEAFEEEGIPYVRFDGQISAKRRQDAIARFSVPIVGPVTQAPPSDKHDHVAVDYDSATESDSDFAPEGVDEQADDEDTDLPRPKGEGKGKAKSASDESRVMLISLKAGGLGLNLTVANHVFLMDPWWQEGIESQAIDRVNRIGQRKPVHVYQMIAEDTVEAKVLAIQDRKNKMIKEAFSGNKTKEVQRQRREAKLQDIIELFGISQRDSQEK